MKIWLEGFAYKISPDIWMYVLAGTTALLIAVATISFDQFGQPQGIR